MTVNRRDLVAIPVPNANLLWRELHTRHMRLVDGRQRTDNICIEALPRAPAVRSQYPIRVCEEPVILPVTLRDVKV